MTIPAALAVTGALGAASALGVGGFMAALQADHGIPADHAEAYIRLAAEAPCPIDYRIPAAIGAIESGHGTSRVRSDSGLITSYAGAEGDMQIMPATFAAHATDGDGDGRAVVTDRDDSIATAIAYLCASNVDEDLDTALYAYNHDWGYVADVKARMAALPPLEGEVDSADQAKRIVDAATAWVGRDFRPGVGEQCAFFVRQVLQDAGVTLTPDVTAKTLDGFWTGAGIANSFGADQGTAITDIRDVRAGDIVMFENTYGAWERGAITHVGVAVSPTEMVDRSTASAPVKRRPLTTFPYFGGAVRLKGSPNAKGQPQAPLPEGPTASQVMDALLGKGLEAGASLCERARQDPRLAPVCDAAGETGKWVME